MRNHQTHRTNAYAGAAGKAALEPTSRSESLIGAAQRVAASSRTLCKRGDWARELLVLALVFLCVPAAGAQSVNVVTDHGGPVMQAPTVFLIFWLPSGFHYDSSSTAAADTTYESLMSRFFTDMSGSNYLNIMSQYPGVCGPPNISNQTPCFGGVTVGGTTIDTSAYTTHAGTTASPLSDADMQAEVRRFITAKQLTPGLNTEFFVFVGAGVVVCTGTGFCDNTFPGFCAYHSSFQLSGNTVVYGVMPNADSFSGCGENISSGPNQLAADREIIAMSHEFSESISDPRVNDSIAWNDGVANREIGDNCNTDGNPVLGSIAGDGSNTTINGHLYVLQTEWSNDDDGCILSFANKFSGPTVENTFTTGSDDLRDNSSVSGVLQARDGSSGSVFVKAQGQPSWSSNSIHVRVSSNGLTAPVQQELLTLTSHSGFLQGNDHWDIQGIDLKLRNANGSPVCEESQSGSPLASITDGSPVTFPTPNCLPPPPPQEAVVCSVFDDGYTNMEGPSDAIFISGRDTNNEKGKACIPGGDFGHCHKWFGRCHTVSSNVAVSLQVFDDGYANMAGPSDAIYIPTKGNQACVPDQTSTGTCRRWFGRGTASDGRHVFSIVFDDGYANQSNLSDATYIPSPIPSPGSACVPDPTPTGLCRRWFGRFVAQ
jgi:hypothetical protein